jgi:hypothetical protein
MKPEIIKGVLGGSVASVALVGIFSLYGHPYLLLKLADHLWACF